MHWCDSIEFELVGTDCRKDLDHNSHKSIMLEDLRLESQRCEFCSDLLRLIEYRLRCDVAKRVNERHTLRLTDEEIRRDTLVQIGVHFAKEARNWSFNNEGTSYRTVIDLTVLSGLYPVDILLQRAGPGGRVPVTHKSETKYGSNTFSYIAPGSWGTEGSVSLWDLSWEDQPRSTAGRIEVALGRQRPLQIDFSTLGRWMNICDGGHALCKSQYRAARVPRLRLVDVNKMCIIDVSSRDHYPKFAALSYVWGTEPFLRLSRDNLKHLMTPGSLDKTPPPLTIRDALQICNGLQIQFIWVDSLCIIQDDKSDMIEIVDSMDSIYRQSVITIVAASGANADAGIPGVRPETRHLEQHTLQARGVPFIDSVDSNQLGLLPFDAEPMWVSDTPWAQRAWTFQEGLVSRRLLFFTAEQVYWSCRRGLLSEDTVEHFSLEDGDAEPKRDLYNKFDPKEYQSLAITFSKRNLTYESDIQRAYLGIQNHLDKKWGGHKFSWGLPHGCFGSFLIWEWQFSTGSRLRNGTHPIKSIDGTVTRASFPSWSWMGWTGGHGISYSLVDDKTAHCPSFYTFNSVAKLIAIQDGQYQTRKPKPLAELLPSSETGNGDSNWEKDITEADFTPTLLSTPAMKHSALLFYTQTARVRYDPTIAAGDTSEFGTTSDFSEIDETYPFSVVIGSEVYHILEEHQQKSQRYTGTLEQVKLAAVFAKVRPGRFGTRDKFKLYCWPIIERDGMWMRASNTSTVLSLEMWKSLPRKRWELVSMI
ncbi:unnamed protein product [Clonostachys solani]|uniref:Heterokaryon incompatibility domain-containing protein n=1 Tax=Clonostachys solani TaxID=160281 RepID=A0A9N9ZED1_9HYPO|nr:unnamed protein product [Clonostachys solani]